jgi:ubiquinone/menaquinone biosynthesis C-methylase UbiE
VDHADHVRLIRGGVEGRGGAWADFGAGSGAFTLALAEVLGPDADIVAVDKDDRALRVNEGSMRARFPDARVRFAASDFLRPLAISDLDGIVLANSLHFQRDHAAALRAVRGYLKPGGRLVIVEYNIERGNFAVPHPVPFARWERLAREAGFEHTELLERRPSRFLNEIYSAVSW